MLDRYHAALRAAAPFALSLLRIVAALVLLEHGTQKMFDFPPMQRFGPPGGLAQAGGPAGAQRPPNAAAVSSAGATGVAQSAPRTGAAQVGAGGAAPPGSGGGGRGGPPQYLFPIAGWIETVAGALLVLGLFSRSAAFLLSGETAAVYFIAHAPMSFYPIANGGEAAVLFVWTFLYLFFAGPGPLSLDALWRRIRGQPG